MRALALALALALPAFADDRADAGVAAEPAVPQAEPLGFKAALDKAEVGLAEPFSLHIEVRHPASDTYELPVRLDWKPFGVRSKKTERTGTDPVVTHIRIEVQAFEVGELEIPGIRLTAESVAGVRFLEIPPQKIRVNGIIDPAQGEPQMREDTRPLPVARQPLWWPTIVIALLAAAALAYLYYMHRMNRPKPAPPPRPRDPPDVEAYARLAVLEGEGLIAQGLKRDYYFRLSDIVRDYLGRRFAFDALEQTSDELLQELRKRPTPGLDLDALATFLRGADLVKFAKGEPTDGEAKLSMDTARQLVDRTRPPPPAAEQKGGAAA